ncbi:MAG: hypothetical protein RLZZ214_3516 [Verrucomicrobiota bacterium]|jgi:prepilin-type N-terminal cleavage/methylation domain-containing protein/prepilin-type processing-associated H-X9-DG protein
MKQRSILSRTRRSSSGFTLVELLVVVTIIIVLAGVGYPTIGKMRATAERSRCMNQLREWGIIMGAYASEHDGKAEWYRWPSIGTDPDKVSVYLPYMSSGSVDVTTKNDQGSYDKLLNMRNCPSNKWDKRAGNSPVSYAMIRPNPVVSAEQGGNMTIISKISNPSRFIMMIDALPAQSYSLNSAGDFTARVKPLTQKGSSLRHNNATVNALMGDFSVQSMNWKQIEKGLSYWTNY